MNITEKLERVHVINISTITCNREAMIKEAEGYHTAYRCLELGHKQVA
jgi:hypothetical protein